LSAATSAIGVAAPLTAEEVELVTWVGSRRQTFALRQNLQHAHRFNGDGYSVHIRGAATEYVVARFTGEYWPAYVGDPRKAPPDVGADIEVRGTPHRDGCLIVHPGDPDASRFYLVTGTLLDLVIVGWLPGGAAKRREWWRRDVREPAFFVPQSALLPPEVEW
jgi:hypothetical protein